jgi:hypothetical protein
MWLNISGALNNLLQEGGSENTTLITTRKRPFVNDNGFTNKVEPYEIKTHTHTHTQIKVYMLD